MTYRCTPYPALSTKDFDTTVAAVVEPWALVLETKWSATFITGSVVYSHEGNYLVLGNALSFDLFKYSLSTPCGYFAFREPVNL